MNAFGIVGNNQSVIYCAADQLWLPLKIPQPTWEGKCLIIADNNPISKLFKSTVEASPHRHCSYQQIDCYCVLLWTIMHNTAIWHSSLQKWLNCDIDWMCWWCQFGISANLHWKFPNEMVTIHKHGSARTVRPSYQIATEKSNVAIYALSIRSFSFCRGISPRAFSPLNHQSIFILNTFQLLTKNLFLRYSLWPTWWLQLFSTSKAGPNSRIM